MLEFDETTNVKNVAVYCTIKTRMWAMPNVMVALGI